MSQVSIGKPATLIDKVIETIRQRIASRSLTPGSKLPSVRALAKTMGLSTSTVVEAYERLAAEGAIRSRPGSGFYVASALAPLSLADIGPRLDREIDPLWISRQSLDSGEELLKPGCGWLPPTWMPEASLRRALRVIARAEPASVTDYGAALGLAALRRNLARRLGAHGVDTSPNQIVLTESGTQALDLICRFLLEPGEIVLVDDPCYFNFHALLRSHRARIISVPYTPTGPDLDLFEKALSEHRPRLYITNSGIHNPTGATLSAVVAHRLLKLAEKSELTIVEDDIFADFEHTPAPRLAAFDGLSRVIQIGSFSKTLSAAIRCGYIAAPKHWVEALADLKIATSFGGGRLASELVLAVLEDGSYRRHMDALKIRLAKAMSETIVRLRHLGISPWIEPQAGMFLWCRLPDGVEANDIATQGLAEGIIFAPGNAFSLAQSASGFMRMNVAQSSDPKIVGFLERAISYKTRGRTSAHKSMAKASAS